MGIGIKTNISDGIDFGNKKIAIFSIQPFFSTILPSFFPETDFKLQPQEFEYHFLQYDYYWLLPTILVLHP